MNKVSSLNRKASSIFLGGCLLLSALFATGTVNAFNDSPSSKEFVPQFTSINFNSYTPTPFGNQDEQPTMTIEDGGNTLHLQGN